MIKRSCVAFFAAALLGVSPLAPASGEIVPSVSVQTLSWQCFVSAGQRYRIDPLLLYAIAQVESNLNPSAINRNRNGSIDYGLMQVNSLHLPRLKAMGIDEQRLLSEPCLSVDAGASILAGMIDRHGYTWTAVGAYNAGGGTARSEARSRYATKVWRAYESLRPARGAQGAVSTVSSGGGLQSEAPAKSFRWDASEG